MPTKPLAPKTVAALKHRIRDDGVEPGLIGEDSANAFRVLDAICTMHANGEIATREKIVEFTQLNPTTVDDRIKALRGERLISAEKQNYAPLPQYAPAEPISMTVLGDGMCKVEKGDSVMQLNPTEARNLGQMLAGRALNRTAIDRVQELEAMVLELSRTIREQNLLVKSVEDARSRKVNKNQLSLVMD